MRMFSATGILVVITISLFQNPIAAFQPASTDAWYDNCTGTAMTAPVQWTCDQVNALYSWTDSYMFVSLTAQTTTTGTLKSSNLSADFNICDTLEMRVIENEPRVNFQWKIQLRGMDGPNPLNAHALHDLSGANGVFSFPIQELTNWIGQKEFRLEINFENSNTVAAHHYTLFDYFRVFQNTSDRIYFWRDDFEHHMATGLEVNNWWDNEAAAYGENQHAVIRYANPGARVYLTDDSKGLVRSPGVYWDTQKYYIFEMNVSELQPGVRGRVVLLQIDDYEVNKEICTFNHDGLISIDLRTIPDWPWLETHMLTVELHIEGTAGQYYELSSISFLADKNPKPLPTATPLTFPQGCYAMPNPFVPEREPVQFFTRLADSTAAVEVRIMNLQGRIVRVLDGLSWDGRDDHGQACEGGIYIYQIMSDGKRVSGKVVLIR